MKKKPLVTGIIALASTAIPFLFLLCGGKNYANLFNFDTVPLWMSILLLLPLLISPVLGIIGIVHGYIKRKEKLAWLGILLSAQCLLENLLLIAGMYILLYLGKTF